MGSDPRYVCHFYDIMENLYAFLNDTLLVVNRNITVSEDKHGNLSVIGSKYYFILGSVDSKQMVKNICKS